jgi:hypothetical protein
VRSSFFEDRSLFPEGSLEFDGALLMRGLEHEWNGKSDLCRAARIREDNELQRTGTA